MSGEPLNVYAPIAARAAAGPGRLAIVTPRARLTYGDLDAAVAKAGQLLLSSGLAQGQRAGISVPENVPHLVLSLALARIGVAQVALPASDAPGPRAAAARDLGLAAVIGTGGPQGDAGALPGIRSIVVGLAALFNRAPAPAVAAAQSADLVWLIMRSSGTTGAPKYAPVSHAVAMMRSRRYGPMFDCGDQDVFWPMSTAEFVVTKQRALFCLQRGAAICFPEHLPTFADRLRFAASCGVTLACGSAVHLNHLLAAFPDGVTVPTLRAFEATSASVAENLRQKFRHAITAHLYVVYATNETFAVTLASPALQRSIPDTVGVPIDSLTVEVVDDADRPLPAGQIGQVRVKGPGVIDAFLDNPEATARSFRQGWHYPGDMASIGAGGALLLHGRADDMMAFDGMKIYPAEIERVLGEHAGVAEAAAFPIRSAVHQHIPAAAVVLRSPVSEEELMAHCRTQLGPKAPRSILILESLPRNAMGKILKRELSGEALRRRRAKAANIRAE